MGNTTKNAKHPSNAPKQGHQGRSGRDGSFKTNRCQAICSRFEKLDAVFLVLINFALIVDGLR